MRLLSVPELVLICTTMLSMDFSVASMWTLPGGTRRARRWRLIITLGAVALTLVSGVIIGLWVST